MLYFLPARVLVELELDWHRAVLLSTGDLEAIAHPKMVGVFVFDLHVSVDAAHALFFGFGDEMLDDFFAETARLFAGHDDQRAPVDAVRGSEVIAVVADRFAALLDDDTGVRLVDEVEDDRFGERLFGGGFEDVF